MSEQRPNDDSKREGSLNSELSIKQEEPQRSEQEMRALYIEQQRRMSCPGCGEGHQIF